MSRDGRRAMDNRPTLVDIRGLVSFYEKLRLEAAKLFIAPISHS